VCPLLTPPVCTRASAQLLNIGPTNAIEVHLAVEELEERLTDEQVQEIIDIFTAAGKVRRPAPTLLPPPVLLYTENVRHAVQVGPDTIARAYRFGYLYALPVQDSACRAPCKTRHTPCVGG
jgi:hypothetical protein